MTTNTTSFRNTYFSKSMHEFFNKVSLLKAKNDNKSSLRMLPRKI